MICLKCDICGNAFDFSEETANHVRFVRISSTGGSLKIADYDICPDCYNAIKKTIDARRKTIDPFEDDMK